MNNVHRLPTKATDPSSLESITPAELKSLIGWLGLTRPWLAKRLKMKGERQVIRWEDGHAPIPEHCAAELVRLWNRATETITMMVNNAAANADANGVVILWTYRVDEDYWNDVGSEEFPATYHRALVCRAMDHMLMRTRYRVQIRYKTPEECVQ